GRCRQLFVSPFRPLGKEFAAFGIRIAGHPQVGEDNVVGQGQIVVPQRFAFLRYSHQNIGRRERTADRQVEPYLHLWLPTRRPQATIAELRDRAPPGKRTRSAMDRRDEGATVPLVTRQSRIDPTSAPLTEDACAGTLSLALHLVFRRALGHS